MIGKLIADIITSVGKSREKEKSKKVEEIYIPPENRRQIIDDLKLFWAMEFQKIVSLLNTISDDKDLPQFFTKNGSKLMINQDEKYPVNTEIRIKALMLRADSCDFKDAYVIVKGDITVAEPNYV